MITPIEASDMWFIAKVGALAKQISEIDYERLNELIKTSPILNSNDDVGEKIKACLAILSFTAKTLQPIVPGVDEVRESTDRLLSKVELNPTKRQELIDKMNKLVMDTLQGDL